MAFRNIAVVAVAAGLMPAACHSTFIDLNPDTSGDRGGADPGDSADADASAPEDGDDSIALDDGVTETDGGGTVITPPPPCGDGVVDEAEECDDGNRKNSDGCTWDCRMGDGDPAPPPDPLSRPYVVEGPPIVLPPFEHPPSRAGSRLDAFRGESVAGTIWYSAETPSAGPYIGLRYLDPDGTTFRSDTYLWLASGSFGGGTANDLSDRGVLLLWAGREGGLWKAILGVDGTIESYPALLVAGGLEPRLSLAPVAGGHLLAWYENPMGYYCHLDDRDPPRRTYLRRLGPDGSFEGMPEPVVLEEPLGANTRLSLSAGDDSSVGLLWWRSGVGDQFDCDLRFGVADAELTTVADGGVIGLADHGRVVSAEGAYRMAWLHLPGGPPAELGFAAFGRDAGLLAAPSTCELTFASYFEADVEVAAGDHGLVTVFRTWDEATGVRLYFVRTDLMGRTAGGTCSPVEVDPSCRESLGCVPGYPVVSWVGDAFVVTYRALFEPFFEPGSPFEMRAVRLVPAP